MIIGHHVMYMHNTYKHSHVLGLFLSVWKPMISNRKMSKDSKKVNPVHAVSCNELILEHTNKWKTGYGLKFVIWLLRAHF